MKASLPYAALAALFATPAMAHTIFQEFYVNGVSQGHLNGIRYPTYDGPITDVTSNDIIVRTLSYVPASANLFDSVMVVRTPS